MLRKRRAAKLAQPIGYGAWSTGNITDEMVQEYLEHHRNPRMRILEILYLNSVEGLLVLLEVTYGLSIHSR